MGMLTKQNKYPCELRENTMIKEKGKKEKN